MWFEIRLKGDLPLIKFHNESYAKSSSVTYFIFLIKDKDPYII